MSAEHLEELRAELKHKVEVERPALAQRLKTARELGDLSENADYIMAKETQGFLEGRIQELEEQIRGATIIDTPTSNHNVQLGSRVTVLEEGESDPEVYLIVGKVEANPREGKISDESPLGMALVGKEKGESVRVAAPGGEMVFKVIDIS